MILQIRLVRKNIFFIFFFFYIALTPYLFGVYVNGEILKVRGIGLCWLYYSVYIGFGLNIPKEAPGFINLTKK